MNAFYKILTVIMALLGLFCFYLLSANERLERAQESDLHRELTEKLRISDSTHEAQYTAKINFMNQKINSWMDSVDKVQAQIIKSKAATKQTENEINHLYLLRNTIHMHPDSLKRF